MSNCKLKIEAINTALEIGEKSGKPKQFDNKKFKKRMKHKLKIVK